MVEVGDTAPDFELLDEEGNNVKLFANRGKNYVVVYFTRRILHRVARRRHAVSATDSRRFSLVICKNTVVYGISKDNQDAQEIP